MNTEWTDAKGTRAVLHDGHLSLYGHPSMTREDGLVAIGIELPEAVRAALEAVLADNRPWYPVRSPGGGIGLRRLDQ